MRRSGPRRLEFTEADLSEMERLWLADWSTDAIGAYFRCLPGSVWARLKKRGVDTTRRGRRKRIVVHSHGYLLSDGEYVHRQVAEQMLGRALFPGECVHHKNGDRQDNRPENLEVHPSHSAHMDEHREERETWTPEQDRRILELLVANYSATRIGLEFGRSPNAIRNRVRRLRRRGVSAPRLRSGRKGNKELEVCR